MMRNFIAAIKSRNSGHIPKEFEEWDLTDVEQQVLARPDDEIIWAADIPSLAFELEQRRGSNDAYSFTILDENHYKVFVSNVPIWRGTNTSEMVKCLEKFGGLVIPKPRLQYSRDPSKSGAREEDPERLKAQRVLRNLRQHAVWENYEARDLYAGSFSGVNIIYKPGAGEERRRIEKYAEDHKKKHAKQLKDREKRSVKLTKHLLELLVDALHAKLYATLPPKIRPPANLRGMKEELATRAVFYFEMLHLMDNPHHKKCPKQLRTALVETAPFVSELRKKAFPYPTLGKRLLKDFEKLKIKIPENGPADKRS